jgi:hypothetical protein
LRFVQAGLDDGDLGVVGDQEPRYAVDRCQGATCVLTIKVITSQSMD